MVLRWISGFFRSLPPISAARPLCIPHSAHHSPPYYRDAGALEKVTALWRRKSTVQPSKGLQFNPLSQPGTNLPDDSRWGNEGVGALASVFIFTGGNRNAESCSRQRPKETIIGSMEPNSRSEE